MEERWAPEVDWGWHFWDDSDGGAVEGAEAGRGGPAERHVARVAWMDDSRMGIASQRARFRMSLDRCSAFVRRAGGGGRPCLARGASRALSAPCAEQMPIEASCWDQNGDHQGDRGSQGAAAGGDGPGWDRRRREWPPPSGQSRTVPPPDLDGGVSSC